MLINFPASICGRLNFSDTEGYFLNSSFSLFSSFFNFLRPMTVIATQS